MNFSMDKLKAVIYSYINFRTLTSFFHLCYKYSFSISSSHFLYFFLYEFLYFFRCSCLIFLFYYFCFFEWNFFFVNLFFVACLIVCVFFYNFYFLIIFTATTILPQRISQSLHTDEQCYYIHLITPCYLLFFSTVSYLSLPCFKIKINLLKINFNNLKLF